MSLYKPGKEHTINVIYCWAAWHPDPSRRSAPYSQRLEDASLSSASGRCFGIGLEHSWIGEGAPGIG